MLQVENLIQRRTSIDALYLQGQEAQVPEHRSKYQPYLLGLWKEPAKAQMPEQSLYMQANLREN